jgi:hypothetical protein
MSANRIAKAAIILFLGTTIVGFLLQRAHSRKGWQDAELSSCLDPGESRTEELEARRRGMLRRLQAKQDIADQVVASRLTLADAAQQFRVLNLDVVESRARTLARHPRPGVSAEERLYREVIAYVRVRLADRPDAAQALHAQLEKEMRRLLARQNPTNAEESAAREE